MKVLISTTTFAEYDDAAINLLKKNKFDVVLNPFKKKLTETQIQDLVKDVDGLIAGTESLTEKVINSANKLKVISRCGTGIDNVDLKAAERKNISVLRTVENPALAVAELTLGLMINGLRYISYFDRSIRLGRWEKKMGYLLSEKTVGIVGVGNVGKILCRFLQAFNCSILAYDVVEDKGLVKQYGVKYVSLKELVSLADVISVHLPYTDQTKNLINESIFSSMKKEALFINTSRGEIVDEKALLQALKSQRLSHACLDVFQQEPYEGPLKDLNNITLTAHIGSYAKEARIKMEMEAVKNLIEGFKKR